MIIGVCGLIGSGKGTVADILVNEHGYQKVSFADSLKDAVSMVFGWDRALLEGDNDESREWRERVDSWWAERLDMPGLTPRSVLQKWGTEVCRDGWHRDIWILSLERKIRGSSANIVVPDTRFPNEVDMIKRLGGSIWLVRRGEDPGWFRDYQINGTVPAEIHASEWAWARSRFDSTVVNEGTVEDLHEQVDYLIVNCV